jgi:A/G-specific adenine glycosylase
MRYALCDGKRNAQRKAQSAKRPFNIRVRLLHAWFKQHQRDLPWRHTRDPYRILVSEVMLQQTQVKRVMEFYTKWLRLFPTWQALAQAKTADLLHAWAGLGYNRRALQLRDAARMIVASGRVPQTVEEWRTLKGVGPYTASAVYAFSRHEKAIAIDTNVRRVAGRIFLGIPHPTIKDDGRIEKVLNRAIPNSSIYWQLPQAFMDLGASVCTSSAPLCANCPMRRVCSAAPKFLSGKPVNKPKRISSELIHGDKRYPDRIFRGRILKYIRERRSVDERTIGPRVDPDHDPIADADWMQRMIDRLVKDGLLERSKRTVFLPKA